MTIPTLSGGCEWDEDLMRGHAAFKRGSALSAAARALFEAVVSRSGQDSCNIAAGLTNLGALDLVDGDLDGAVARLERALALEPYNDVALRNLGWAQQQLPAADETNLRTEAFARLFDVAVLRYLVALDASGVPQPVSALMRQTQHAIPFDSLPAPTPETPARERWRISFQSVANTSVLIDAERMATRRSTPRQGGATEQDSGPPSSSSSSSSEEEEEEEEEEAMVRVRCIDARPEGSATFDLRLLLMDRPFEISVFEQPVTPGRPSICEDPFHQGWWQNQTKAGQQPPGRSFGAAASSSSSSSSSSSDSSHSSSVSSSPLDAMRNLYLDHVKRTLVGVFDHQHVRDVHTPTDGPQAQQPQPQPQPPGDHRHPRAAPSNRVQERLLTTTVGYHSTSLVRLSGVTDAGDPLDRVPGTTMASVPVINHLQTCVEAVVREGIEGDLLEAGV